MIDPDVLPPGWWSFLGEFEGRAKSFATYTKQVARPPLRERIDPRFEWLRGRPTVKGSLAETTDDDPRPFTAMNRANLAALLRGSRVDPPADFAMFVEERSLHERVRSCTVCYLDLGEEAVPLVGGGQLVHFLSDQQWVMHWLVCVGSSRSGRVVATTEPLGFLPDDDRPRAANDSAARTVVCASSFAEFIYRFWIENEIWFAMNAEEPLTREQQAYLDDVRAIAQ